LFPVGTSRSEKRNSIKNNMNISSVKAALMMSFLNQMVSSGGNFLVGVYLARTLSLEAFGLYGISLGICMLYIGIGNAVIFTQMVVNIPDKIPVQKDAYATKMLFGALMLGAVTLVLVVVFMLGLMLFRPDMNHLLKSVAAVACTAVFLLLKEFFVSYSYVRRKELWALAVNGLSVLVLAAGLAIEHVAHIQLTPENVLLLYAAGAAVGAMSGYLVSPLQLMRDSSHFMPDFIEAWRHGRWALGGVIVSWVQSQMYAYVLAFFLGPAGVGQANAAKIFISPFSFLLPAINKISVPRLADLRQNNRGRMFKVSLALTGGLFLFAIVYSILLLSNLDFISKLVLGRQDPGIQSLVWVWCFFLVNQMLLSGGSGLLQVLRRFRVLTLINIPSAVVAVLTAVVLIQQIGTPGAIWGTAAGEIVLSLLIWREIRYGRAKDS
jgi:O-antigen/teichoic acid export membrane protein